MIHKGQVIIGSDHGGFRLKEIISNHIKELGFTVENAGCYSAESCDYPIYGHEVAKRVSEGEGSGILICGTGIGMSIVANRRSGIRAALCYDEYTAKMSRKHNNSNVLILGEKVIDEGLALRIVDIWINTEFDGGRHQRRLDIIEEIWNR